MKTISLLSIFLILILAACTPSIAPPPPAEPATPEAAEAAETAYAIWLLTGCEHFTGSSVLKPLVVTQGPSALNGMTVDLSVTGPNGYSRSQQVRLQATDNHFTARADFPITQYGTYETTASVPGYDGTTASYTVGPSCEDPDINSISDELQ